MPMEFEQLLVVRIVVLVLSISLSSAVCSFACREMRRLLKANLMKRWEVGFLSGWLILGTILFCIGSLIQAVITRHSVDLYPVWQRLPLIFGFAVFIGGPIGTVAANFPWHVSIGKRQPKILGCGLHGSLRSRLVMLPGSIANNREFVAVRCQPVLDLSRQRWKQKLHLPKAVEPPPLTNTEWKVINCRVNSDAMAVQLGTSRASISPADAD
ncbi:MAG TPA: hypothetical protein V6D22_02920 [Candidatus Obscuribacterales bacterium]